LGKHHKYSEVKHPDPFVAGLAEFWRKGEPYIIRAGIVSAIVVVGIAVWFGVSEFFTGRGDRPWEERFKLAEEFATKAQSDPEAVGDKLLEKMGEFTREHQGQPAAAVTLLELAQWQLRTGVSRRDEKPKEARAHFEKAAAAAEQFVADFPRHRHVGLAYYEAGKARMELEEWERAVQHFEKATESPVHIVAALARWGAAYSYEQLGRLDQARDRYEALRVDPLAGWCTEQAEFALAQLGRTPPKAPQRDSGTPAPSPVSPAPPK